jgi:hypothetical protein
LCVAGRGRTLLISFILPKSKYRFTIDGCSRDSFPEKIPRLLLKNKIVIQDILAVHDFASGPMN